MARGYLINLIIVDSYVSSLIFQKYILSKHFFVNIPYGEGTHNSSNKQFRHDME